MIKKTATLSILTPREYQIVEMIAWGSSQKEIAYLLHISQRTVENTLRNAYSKLGVNKSNELSALYFTNKYGISLESSPLKRAIVVTFLLFIIIPFEYHNIRQDCVRSKKLECVRFRRSKREIACDDNILYLI